jgi:hypothetical protein
MNEPGIYLNLPDPDYRAIPALSNSGAGNLLVSPLTYWHRHINPLAPKKADTEFTIFGGAVHCELLTPNQFGDHYATALRKDDYPSALVTMEDLKTYCEENGLKKTASRKEDIVERIKLAGFSPVIWDDEVSRHAFDNQGKTFLSSEEMDGVQEIASVVDGDSTLSEMLTGGYPEVSIVIEEPETKRLLKSRLDYVRPDCTTDLKTLTIPRKKTFDQAVRDALFYEDYFRQAVFYTLARREAARQLAAGEIKVHGDADSKWVAAFARCLNPRFEFLFIESTAPFNRQAIELTEYDLGGQQNLYWMCGERKVHEAIHLYDACWSRFGELPWSPPVERRRLHDSDVPQVSFSR